MTAAAGSGAGERPTLRPATPDDRDFLRAVYGSTRVEELATTDWSDEQKEAFVTHQFEAQAAHYLQHYAPHAEYLVIEAAGERVGRLYIARWTSEIRLMDITLLPAYRGRGWGEILVREILEEGQRLGKKVSIHVEMYNPALRLYDRLGFKALSEYGMYYLMEWQPTLPENEVHV